MWVSGSRCHAGCWASWRWKMLGSVEMRQAAWGQVWLQTWSILHFALRKLSSTDIERVCRKDGGSSGWSRKERKKGKGRKVSEGTKVREYWRLQNLRSSNMLSGGNSDITSILGHDASPHFRSGQLLCYFSQKFWGAKHFRNPYQTLISLPRNLIIYNHTCIRSAIFSCNGWNTRRGQLPKDLRVVIPLVVPYRG